MPSKQRTVQFVCNYVIPSGTVLATLLFIIIPAIILHTTTNNSQQVSHSSVKKCFYEGCENCNNHVYNQTFVISTIIMNRISFLEYQFVFRNLDLAVRSDQKSILN